LCLRGWDDAVAVVSRLKAAHNEARDRAGLHDFYDKIAFSVLSIGTGCCGGFPASRTVFRMDSIDLAVELL
jgi:hypothetical protein